MNILNILDKTKDVIYDLSSGQTTGIPYKMQNLIGDMILTPNVIMTNTCKDYDCFGNLCKFHTELFASFMVKTFTILSEAYGLSAPQLLNVVKSNHNVLDDNESVMSHIKYMLEDGSFKQDTAKGIDNVGSLLVNKDTFNDKISQPYKTYQKTNTKASHENPHYTVSMDNTDFISKLNKTNIITININIRGSKVAKTKEGENIQSNSSVTLPITIMPNFIFVSENQLVDGLFDNHIYNTISARWLAYRAGEISFMDLVFAGDLIKEARHKQLINNPINEIKTRSREIETINKGGRLLQYFKGDSVMKELLKNPNFSPYYNMLIVDKNTKERLDKEMGNDTLDYKVRDRLLNKLFGLSYTVVDPDYQLIDFGIEGIKVNNTITWKKLKSEENGSTDKIIELMSTLLTSRSVSI